MDNAVAARFQGPQKGRQHARGFLLGVVQQDDAAPDALDTPEQQVQLLIGCHWQPVAGPDVGAEHGQAAPLHQRKQRRARGKPGKTKEGARAPIAAKRRRNGTDAAVDLRLGAGESHVTQQRVRIAVGAEAVSFRPFAANQPRVGGSAAADKEKRRLHALCLQGIEHLRCCGRPRTVVKGQHQLLVVERQRDRKLLAADARGHRGVDHKDPCSAERIGMSGAGLGDGRKRRQCKSKRGNADQGGAQDTGQLSAHLNRPQACLRCV